MLECAWSRFGHALQKGVVHVAQLHEGEKVLTRNEAKQYQEGSGKNFTFNYYSPESIDPYKANKLFKQSVRELEEGFVG